MMRNWCTPRERGLAPEGRSKHHKKNGGKKPFIIEWRYIGPSYTWYKWNRDWRVCHRYKTEKSRDQALENLVRKSKDPNGYGSSWEYRIP